MQERLFAKNPSELHIIENPNIRRNNMAKKSNITTDKAITEYKAQAVTAGYILGGQAIAAQVNALAVPSIVGNASAVVQQAIRAGLPLTTGVFLTLMTKNSHLRGLAMGMGVQGVMELIKFVMPDFQQGASLMDGSGYIFKGGGRSGTNFTHRDSPQLPEHAGHTSQIETSHEVEESVEV